MAAGEIDDGKAAKREPQAAVRFPVETLVIGTPVNDGPRHRAQRGVEHLGLTRVMESAGYAAHGRAPYASASAARSAAESA